MEELLWKIGSMAVVIGFIVLIVYLNKTDEKRTTKRAKERLKRRLEKGIWAPGAPIPEDWENWVDSWGIQSFWKDEDGVVRCC